VNPEFGKLRKENVKFTVTNQWVATNNRKMERLVLPYQTQNALNEFLTSKVGDTTQASVAEMGVLIRITTGAPERALSRNFD
jgi:hypothetical protein